MINEKLFRKEIACSGENIFKIARKIGMNPVKFYLVSKGIVDLTANDIYKICDILQINDTMKMKKIFFN